MKNEGMRRLRSWRGVRTQAAAAEMLGLTQSSYSLYEHGHRCPGIGVAIRIEQGTSGKVPVTSWMAVESDPS